MQLANLHKVIAVLFLCLLCQGCNGSGGSSTPTTPAPAPAPSTLPKALNCIVGKTINISGTYYVPLTGTGIDISRQAVISSDLFKVQETGGDELAERSSEETKIGTWEGDYISLTADGTHGHGFNDETMEDCFEVKYEKGPFTGPSGGQCSISISATICEDTCTIQDAKWELKCGVNADGSGGSVRAHGGWSVQN